MPYPARAVRGWRRALAPLARRAPRPDPRRSALLVIDMQRYFAGTAAPILDTVAAAMDGARRAGARVVLTQHGHDPADASTGMLAEWWGDDLIMEASAGHALLDGLPIDPADTILPKRRYCAFRGTDLADILAGWGVDDLAIAGLMTNLCVETTARTAFVRDLRVRVLLDATATSSESMHVASLVNLAYGFAYVQTAGAWVRSLSA